jgi:hypothetical protein
MLDREQVTRGVAVTLYDCEHLLVRSMAKRDNTINGDNLRMKERLVHFLSP